MIIITDTKAYQEEAIMDTEESQTQREHGEDFWRYVFLNERGLF